MTERIRIKDIAEKTGVSVGTVDRVIHDRGNVAADVRERVLAVMADMGYQPNIIARTLATKKVSRVVALLPDFRADPYWAQPKEGVEKAAAAAQHYGVSVEFSFYKIFDPEDFLRQGQAALQTVPDAVLLAPLFLTESLALLREMSALGVPNVLINTNLDSADTLCYIGQDSYQSGVLAARLLDFGLDDGDHAMVLNLDKGVTNARHLLEKERGFKDYFAGAQHKNIHIHAAVFEDFDRPKALATWLETQLAEQPALCGFFVTNSRAYKLVEAAPAGALERLKIVGFDLIEPNLQHLTAGRISFLINQNAWHQGYLGLMALVNKLILKKEIPPAQFLPLDIVVRENAGYYLARALDLPMAVV